MAEPPRRRIAAPDRASAQALLAMDVVPVASVSQQFYDSMGGALVLPKDVVDCGEPVEPNLEVLRKLGVDLIVTTTIDADINDMLRRVAPVFSLNIYQDKAGALERAKQETQRLGDWIGAGPQARAFIRDFDAALARDIRRSADYARRSMYLVSLSDDGRNMNVFGRNSLMFDVMEKFGIANAWTGPTSAFGIASAGIEELAHDPSAGIAYIDYGPETDAAIARLSQSPFWRALPMVRQGRVYRIGKFDALGGLPAAAQFSSLLADALARISPA